MKHNKLIWVIDDDDAILEATATVLLEEGYSVQIINDPTSISKRIQKESLPALIYLDILMSGVDGRDVVKILHSQKQTEKIPVILLSANIRIDEIAKNSKVNGYLKKPFDIDDLIELTKKYIPS